jgi:SAM-dependent methyltransferase
VGRRWVLVDDRPSLEDLESLLVSLQLTKKDVLYDLNCGDGQAALMAVLMSGCRAVGVDSSSSSVELAKRNAAMNGRQGKKRTAFYHADPGNVLLWKHATVVISYRRPYYREQKPRGAFYVWRKQP